MVAAASVAVVGAGISGLLAARTLAQAGCRVRLFDKARGPGGRMATRRRGGFAFDFGAQYFTVRDDVRVRPLLDAWIEAGVVAAWRPRLAVLAEGAIRPSPDAALRYVGTPRMSALTRHLARGLDVRPGTRVESISRVGERWEPRADEALGRFDAVLVTAPPEQAAPLLLEAPALADRVRRVVSEPCWAAMVVFAAPLALPFDGAFVHDGPLTWVARDASKPGRAPHEAWVLQASPDWSRTRFDAAPEDVARALVEAFLGAAACPRQPTRHLDAHRWGLARAIEALDVGSLWDPTLRLGACGDWCAGQRVEGAILSGLDAGARIAETLGVPVSRPTATPS